MRQLVIDKIMEFVADGFDLSDLMFNDLTTVDDLPSLSDEQLLEIYVEAGALYGFKGFNG